MKNEDLQAELDTLVATQAGLMALVPERRILELG